MFELTIAQAIIVAFALIVGTIIIAQPLRRKVTYMKIEVPEIRILAHSIIRELNEVKLGEHVLVGIGRMLENMTPNSVVAFPRKDMTLEEQTEKAGFPGLYASVGYKVMKVKNPETLLTKKNVNSLFEASLVPVRKSRAGEKRKASSLPANASAEQKRLLKNRLKTREYRAKKRAALLTK